MSQQSASSGSEKYLIVDDQMYVVQSIKGKKYVGGKALYLVKWLGWDDPQDLTWEPIENLQTVKDLIQNYEEGHADTKVSSSLKKHQRQRQSKQKSKQKRKQQIKNEIKAKIKQKKQFKKQKRQKSSSKIKKQKKNNTLSQNESISSEEEEGQLSQRKQESSSSSIVEHKKKQSENNDYIKKLRRMNLRLGYINQMLIQENGQIFYQVDIQNEADFCVGVAKLSSKDVRVFHKQQLALFLERTLIAYDKQARLVQSHKKSLKKND